MTKVTFSQAKKRTDVPEVHRSRPEVMHIRPEVRIRSPGKNTLENLDKVFKSLSIKEGKLKIIPPPNISIRPGWYENPAKNPFLKLKNQNEFFNDKKR